VELQTITFGEIFEQETYPEALPYQDFAWLIKF
jgi:hypothetical protein